jgi:hypothetical protein
MSKNFTLVLGAAILVVAAAGVLTWLNLLQIPGLPGASTSSTQQNSDTLGIELMRQNASPDGIAITFSEADVSSWEVTDGHQIERFKLSDSAIGFGRLTSAHPLNPEDKLSGLRAKIPVEFAQRTNGKRIEVGIVARQAPSKAAHDVSFLYATMQKGNSGWRSYKLGSNFQAFRFLFDVPAVAEGYQASPLIVIRSDRAQSGRAVEIAGVYVKEVPR